MNINSHELANMNDTKIAPKIAPNRPMVKIMHNEIALKN